MVSVSELGIHWRGYPVALVSDGIAGQLRHASDPGAVIAHLLSCAEDTAEPGEPSGWQFEAWPGGTGPQPVYIERFGGIRDEDRHEGGMWSIYLAGER